MTQGRQAPPEKLFEWTSQDTGRTLNIRKVSTLLRAEIRRQILKHPDFAEPQPPRSEVDYGDGKITVANRSHPVYQQLLSEWRVRVMDELAPRLKQAAIDRGVVLGDGEIDTAAVEEVRASIDGLDAYDDRHVYIAFVCVGSEEDWTDLLATIFQRSAPQEAAVQAHIATFQPDIQEPAAV